MDGTPMTVFHTWHICMCEGISKDSGLGHE